MKLAVQGIEEIEITDPTGFCNPPVPQPGQPSQSQPQIPLPSRPQPQVPNPNRPFDDPRPPRIPGAGDVTMPPQTSRWYRHVHDPPNAFPGETKLGVGGSTIQQAGEALEKDRWEKNWQASMGERDGDGHALEN
ncbi:hypothetical protein ES703_61826 [subsurface metagenome]